MLDQLPDVVVTLGSAAVAALVALVAVQIVHAVVRRLGRHSPLLGDLARRAHQPAQAFAILIAVQSAVAASSGRGQWREPVRHLIWLSVIGAGAWLVTALLLVLEDGALSRFRTDVKDNRAARKVRTQVLVVRRLTVAAVGVIAVGAMLMTFPAARAAGASLLASAGIAGVVAGLAAQSLLSNLIAGMQLAFSDELRLDDVVVVEKEWGRVEDITLSYVVLHLWDDRRLTLPTSYFTTKPFQNWTRSESALLGTVEMDLDWAVPVAAVREELRRVLEGTDLWDERVCVLQVTDAVSAMVRIRALVSAVDAGTLFDLRCHVRERLVGWIQVTHPDALPRTRAELGEVPTIHVAQSLDGAGPAEPEPAADAPSAAVEGEPGPKPDARIFGGSPDGRERSAAFTGPHEERG